MKTCPRCKVKLSFSAFGKDKQTVSGLDCYCKVCKRTKSKEWKQSNREQSLKQQQAYREKNREKIREYNRQYDRLNKDKVKSQDLKSKYGIDLNQYNSLLVKQSFSCKICAKHKDQFSKELAVDHDHVTGKVRGLLCTPCNTAIGSFYDKPVLLRIAANYLEAN